MPPKRYGPNTFLRPDGADRIRFYKTIPQVDGTERFVMLGDQKLADDVFAIRQIAYLKRSARRVRDFEADGTLLFRA